MNRQKRSSTSEKHYTNLLNMLKAQFSSQIPAAFNKTQKGDIFLNLKTSLIFKCLEEIYLHLRKKVCESSGKNHDHDVS